MLNWALTFFVVAMVAALLGFGGLAGEMAGVAKILFLVFLVLFAVSYFTGRRGRIGAWQAERDVCLWDTTFPLKECVRDQGECIFLCTCRVLPGSALTNECRGIVICNLSWIFIHALPIVSNQRNFY